MTRAETAAKLGRHVDAIKADTGADLVAVIALVNGAFPIAAHVPDVETLVLLLERVLRDIRRSDARIVDKRTVTP